MNRVLTSMPLIVVLILCGCGQGKSVVDATTKAEHDQKAADDARENERRKQLASFATAISKMAKRHDATVRWDAEFHDEGYTFGLQQGLEGPEKKPVVFIGFVTDIERVQDACVVRMFLLPAFDSGVTVHLTCTQQQAKEIFNAIPKPHIYGNAALAVATRNLVVSRQERRTVKVNVSTTLESYSTDTADAHSSADASPDDNLLIAGELMDFVPINPDFVFDLTDKATESTFRLIEGDRR